MDTRPIPVMPATAPFPAILPRTVRQELQLRLVEVERRLLCSSQGESIRNAGMAPSRLGDVMLRWLKAFVVEAEKGFMDALEQIRPSISGHLEDRTVRQIREFVGGQIEDVLYRFEDFVIRSDEDDAAEAEYAKKTIREAGSHLSWRFELKFLDWVRDHPELAQPWPGLAKELHTSTRKKPRRSAARKREPRDAPHKKQMRAYSLHLDDKPFRDIARDLDVSHETARQWVILAKQFAGDTPRSKSVRASKLPTDNREQPTV